MSDPHTIDRNIISDVELILDSPDLTHSQLIETYNYLVKDFQDKLISEPEFEYLKSKILVMLEKRTELMFKLFNSGEITPQLIDQLVIFLVAIGILKFNIELSLSQDYSEFEFIDDAKVYCGQTFEEYKKTLNIFDLRRCIHLLLKVKSTLQES